MEAIVEYNYVAQEPDELTLRKGDIIKDIKIMPGGWWEGSLRDKCGMFPDNFVKILTPSPSGNGTISKSESEEVTLRNGSAGRRYCKVLFSYDPCNEDELPLVPQDSVEFLGEVEEGWWRGRLRGRIGVFPSNFVTPPTPDDSTDRGTKEFCRVLFPYKASNDDELTIEEGDIVTLLSRDAPDKGWWKGELNGKTGLFPDNFVEVVGSKADVQQQQEQWQEMSQSVSKTTTKHSYTGKKGEKANVRKSLDSRTSETSKKVSSATSTMSSTSSISSSNDKKSLIGNHSILSNLKRMVEKPSDNGETSEISDVGLGEELDGVERGEGAPLSHLTASRAKAPRRRLPSSQHFRSQGANLIGNSSVPPGPSPSEESMINGSIDTVDQFREEEGEGGAGKSRRIAPWIEELKQNQMEKRKVLPPEKPEKVEIKKERCHPRSSIPTSIQDSEGKSNLTQENVEARQREKDKEREPSQRPESSYLHCPVSPTTTGATPAYVPYRLYSQLLDRVTALEEKHTVLQRTVAHLSEQLSTSTNKH